MYQWLHRGTDDRPVPSDRVPAIISGARRDGIAVDIAVLWPAIAEANP